MSHETLTYSSPLPPGILISSGTLVRCGLVPIPASFPGPSLEGEADTPIILPGPGDSSPTSSAALPIQAHDILGETVTWSYSSLPPDVSLNSQTGLDTGGFDLPD